ncbi:MAG: hypothetical protein V3T05_11275 [Myxococcota bacterium]
MPPHKNGLFVISFLSVLALATHGRTQSPPSAESGPRLDLPPESEAAEATAAAAEPEADLLRGLQELRFRTAEKTGIGGYAEMHYNHETKEGDADGNGTIDFHRLVIFLVHTFSNDLRFYSELEVEHAFAGGGGPGEVEIEQAFIDYRLAGDLLTLRAGIILVPMGIINQWHEPPVFHGVERPLVDKRIIPSTWREAGIGFVGAPAESVHYELYLVSGLDPTGFSAKDGIRGGRQHVAKARANDFAVTGRLEYEPVLGVVVGASGYYGEAGDNAGALFTYTGAELELGVPVLGYSADARARWKGLEARALYARFDIGSTARLRNAYDGDGELIGPDVGSSLHGYYVELAFDVLSLLDHDQQLLPFARYESSDTMLHATRANQFRRVPDAQEITDIVFGISYRPVPAVVFKGDVILRDPVGADNDATIVNLGLGVMF